MAHQVALNTDQLRASRALMIGCLVILSAVAGYSQQPTHVESVTHPGGLTRVELESPVLMMTGDVDNPDWIYYPAGRFQLWTGPAGPIGGDPTRSGDEALNIASVTEAGTYGRRFTSKVTSPSTRT